MKATALHKTEPQWHLIDAEGKVLGRIATEAANLLRGKAKPEFTMNFDCGDHVVIVNAEKVVLTGNKINQKMYHHASWFIGGLKTKSAKIVMETEPEFLLTNAINGMLPKNKLQAIWIKRLHVYAGTNHPHAANVPSLPVKNS